MIVYPQSLGKHYKKLSFTQGEKIKHDDTDYSEQNTSRYNCTSIKLNFIYAGT